MIKLNECPTVKTSDNDVLQVELHHKDPANPVETPVHTRHASC